MLYFKSCKRCKGDVGQRKEDEGTELFCLNCGYVLPYELGLLLDIRNNIKKQINKR